jgi:hypothetical protein
MERLGTKVGMRCAVGDGGRGAAESSPCKAEWGEERGAARDGSGYDAAALEKATARSLALEKGAAWRSGLTSSAG